MPYVYFFDHDIDPENLPNNEDNHDYNQTDEMTSNKDPDKIQSAVVDPYTIVWFGAAIRGKPYCEDCFANISPHRTTKVYQCGDHPRGLSMGDKGREVDMSDLNKTTKSCGPGTNWNLIVDKTQVRGAPTHKTICIDNAYQADILKDNKYRWIEDENTWYNCSEWYKNDGKEILKDYFTKNYVKYFEGHYDKEKKKIVPSQPHKGKNAFKTVHADTYNKLYCEALTQSQSIDDQDGKVISQRFHECIAKYHQATDQQKKNIYYPIFKKWCLNLNDQRVNNPFCNIFARTKEAKSDRSEYDAAWTNYCKDNKNKSACSCLEADNRDQALCFSLKCNSVGYQTKDMNYDNCPDLCNKASDLASDRDIKYCSNEVGILCQDYDVEVPIFRVGPKCSLERTYDDKYNYTKIYEDKVVEEEKKTEDKDDDKDNRKEVHEIEDNEGLMGAIIGTICVLLCCIALGYWIRKRRGR